MNKTKSAYNCDKGEKLPCVETCACSEPKLEESGVEYMRISCKDSNHVPPKKDCWFFWQSRNGERVLERLVKEEGITHGVLGHFRLVNERYHFNDVHRT